jgi:hypothetical protein
MLIPDGDRRHGTESGGVVNEKNVLVRDDYVVGEFVLSDHFRDDVRMNFVFGFERGPSEHVVEAVVAVDLGSDRREIIIGQ